MLHLLLPLVLAPPAPLDFEFRHHRSIIATAGVPLEAPRIAFAAAEMTHDGVTDLIVLPQAAGQEYLPRLLEAAYTRDSVGFLPGVAEDIASARGLPGIEETDPVFTVSSDTLRRHAWSPEGEPVVEPYVDAAWQGGDLRCVAVANASATLRYVAVADGSDPTTIHVLTDDGSTIQSILPPFPVSGVLRDIELLDFESVGDGVPSHVAIRTTTSVEIRELNGTLTLSVPGSFAHWTVLRGVEPAPDALALVSGAPGQNVVTTVHPVHGVLANPLPGWTLVGVDAGDVDGDQLPDLAYCTVNPMRWGVLPNEGWTAPFDTASAEDVFTSVGGLLGAPHLFNHDNDDDLDLMILSEDVLHVYLGGVPGDEEGYMLDVNGTIGQGVGTLYTFTLQEPPSLPPGQNVSLAYRMHYQRPFSPTTQALFVQSGEQLVTEWPATFAVSVNQPPSFVEVYFLEFVVLDNTSFPRQSYPVTNYVWAASPNEVHVPDDSSTWDLETDSQLGPVCLHLDVGICLPKSSVGIMRIGFIPPPLPPGSWN